jgi:large subunit ribosomal protein L4
MTIDVFSATGTKVKSMELPASLFDAPQNWGLMHQAVVMQQANRRQSPAHVKTQSEVQGSTRKIRAQKHTGGARHGAIRNPLMRGGGKIFGPRNIMNYTKDMPKKMRHAALRSSLSVMASKGAIIAIESFPDTIKTKSFAELLKKLPVDIGRNILIVSPAEHKALLLSARNVEAVHTVRASYLNAEEILNARHIVFLVDAIDQADKLFGKKETVANTTKKETVIKPKRTHKPRVTHVERAAAKVAKSKKPSSKKS